MTSFAASSSPSSASTVAYALGAILIALSALLLTPLAFTLVSGQSSAGAFLWASFFSLFAGGLLYVTNRQAPRRLGVRGGVALTILGWLAVCFFSALPYMFGGWQLSLADALFESVSGLTTTGASVVIGLDNAPRDLLFWRSLTQAIGGLGIIILAMTLLPFLRIGGMQLFHAESSDRHDKPLPRMADTGKALIAVYVLLAAFCFMAYVTGGMSAFDALNHALTTVSTGGFSTHDDSFAHYRSARLEWAAVLFMYLGALPFILYVRVLVKRDTAFRRDDQVRYFTALAIFLTAALAASLSGQDSADLADSVRQAAFHVVSVITTTGFRADDGVTWGPFAVALFFFITYLGGCSGSTSGGLKTMRLVILLRVLHRELIRMISPSRVHIVTYNGLPVQEKLLIDVMGFLCFYVTFNVLLTLALHLCGLDFETALGAAAAGIANAGPGIGMIGDPASAYAAMPDAAKWLLMAGMLIGRLEILVFLAVLTPSFWRD